jgi:uncharacterized protein YggE
MKGLFVLGSFLIFATFSGQGEDLSAPRRNPVPGPTQSITVRGEGEAAAAPDRAVLQLGVELQARTAKAAQDGIAEIMHKIVEQLKKLGLSDNALQTAGISLVPIYAKPNPEAEMVDAYRGSDVLRVQIDDLDRVGKAIDAAVAAGANRLQGISFQLRNDLPQRAHALELAVQQAHTKAEAIAHALGVKLGPVHSVSEEGALVEPRPLMMARMAVSTPVEAGEVRVQAAVTITYALKLD